MMAELEVLNCTYCEEPQQGAQRVILPIIMVLIAAVGITGNSLVLFIILGHRDMRTVTNSFVASLALTDIAILVICVIPTAVVYVTNTWKLGEFLCRAASYTQAVTVQATCFTLTAMTVDRYYLIVHAVRSRNTRTVTKAVIINVFIWIVSALIHLPSVVFIQLNEKEECSRLFPQGQTSANIYAVFVFVVMYALPLLVILFCYTKILLQTWQQPGTTQLTKGAQCRTLTRKRKVTKMVFIVVMLFALCWAPIHTLTAWLLTNTTVEPTVLVENLKGSFLCIAYLNSCVNPFVYAFTTTTFRKRFRHVLRPRCCKLHGKISSLIHLASFIYVHLTEDGTCKSDFPNAQVSDKVYGLFSFLGMYIVPLICIMFCYTQILIQIWRKTSGGTESAQAHTRALRRKRKITRMVFIVVVLFAFCWAPIQIFTVWSRFSLSDSDESKDLTVVQNLKVSFVCIAYANSCVNPFVYAFTTTSFRKYFRKMFATCCRSPYKERTSISISMTTKTERLPPGEEDSSI